MFLVVPFSRTAFHAAIRFAFLLCLSAQDFEYCSCATIFISKTISPTQYICDGYVRFVLHEFIVRNRFLLFISLVRASFTCLVFDHNSCLVLSCSLVLSISSFVKRRHVLGSKHHMVMYSQIQDCFLLLDVPRFPTSYACVCLHIDVCKACRSLIHFRFRLRTTCTTWCVSTHRLMVVC